MINLLILLLVAIIITQAVEVLKKIKDWVWSKQWKEGKFGIIFALILGVGAGITIGTELVSALLQAVGIEYAMNEGFVIWSIVCTSLLLTQGSAGLIGLAEKWKLGREALEQALKDKQNK